LSVTTVWVVPDDPVSSDSLEVGCGWDVCESSSAKGDGCKTSVEFSTDRAEISPVPVAVATAAATWTGATGSAFAAQLQLTNSIATTAAVTRSSAGAQL